MTTLELDELLALTAGALLTVGLVVALSFWIVMESRAASAPSRSSGGLGPPSSAEDD